MRATASVSGGLVVSIERAKGARDDELDELVAQRLDDGAEPQV
jgi:hypothetical protein